MIMDINQLNQMPSLDQLSVQTCTQELTDLLNKYNCTLVFEEMRHNGQPVSGNFRVMKKPH